MTDDKRNENEEPIAGDGTGSEDGATADVTEPEELVDAEDADVEAGSSDPAPAGADSATVDDAAQAADGAAPADLSPEDQALLDDAARLMAEDKLTADEKDLLGEMRQDMLRAQAELVNFRKRVERDREANRDVVIAEVIRALIPALDDLTRAEAHGDLADGPMAVIGQKIRAGFDRFGLTQIGAKGDVFDPHLHEALVQLPTPGATEQTVADVVEPGYKLGERVLRAAKVAVAVPA